MNSSRLFPLVIYLWILAVFIINFSSAKKNNRKKHHQKCMTFKNPSNSSKFGQNFHKRVKRIANGWEGDIRQMPWMVYLKTEYQFRNKTQFGASTGSLISPRHVLTCGHCIQTNRMNSENDTITVVYGSANKNEGNRIVLNKTSVHIHPYYLNVDIGPNLFTIKDLAIVDLGQDIKFDETVNSICLVCLGKGNSSNPKGNVTIAGWGDMSGVCDGKPQFYPDVFRWDIVSTHPCLKTYLSNNTFDKVCHEGSPLHSIGGGDSGGPVLAVRNNTDDGRQYQIGVHGGNTCNPRSLRENSFDKIDGEWVEQLTGVKCKSYNED